MSYFSCVHWAFGQWKCLPISMGFYLILLIFTLLILQYLCTTEILSASWRKIFPDLFCMVLFSVALKRFTLLTVVDIQETSQMWGEKHTFWYVRKNYMVLRLEILIVVRDRRIFFCDKIIDVFNSIHCFQY